MKSLKSASALFKSTHAPTLILACGLVGIYTIALIYKLIKPTKPHSWRYRGAMPTARYALVPRVSHAARLPRLGRFEQVFPKDKCLAWQQN